MAPMPSVSNLWQGYSEHNKTTIAQKGAENATGHHNPVHFLELQAKGNATQHILSNPYFNKGSAFTVDERKTLNLHGLLPTNVETIEQQSKRCLMQVRACATDLARYVYLLHLKEKNETLFYRVIADNMFEMLPYVYTPTVGEACERYSKIYTHPHGLYISANDKGNIKSLLLNWRQNHLDTVELIVVSDGSRILGLGDLGINGMGIPVGKGALYVAAGGFHPSTVLPVILDTGTNNENVLKDEFYLGLRQPRIGDNEFYALVDEFLLSVKQRWPSCLVQFEDFSNNHCFDLLSGYRDKLLCFNDDIQGTGAVIASGFLNAIKVAGIKDVADLRIVFLGTGSAGVGVAQQIGRSLKQRFNLSAEICNNMFYMIDSKGLITTARGDANLAEFKKPYLRRDQLSNSRPLTDLEDIIRTIKPHALIGLSGQAEAFGEKVILAMAETNQRPIIFPLSNPTKNSECTAEAAYKLTDGRVVFASGSPFSPVDVTDKATGKVEKFHPSQGNNMYVFPGLGFGAWLGRCRMVTDDMLTVASVTLADAISEKDLAEGKLYPPLSDIRAVSALIAGAVMDCARAGGLSDLEIPGGKKAHEYAAECMYFPDYTNERLSASL